MEIEKKFLVNGDGWKQYATTAPTPIVQHYFPATNDGIVSIQHVEQGDGRHILFFKRFADGATMVVPIPEQSWDDIGIQGQRALFSTGSFMNLGVQSSGRVRFAGNEAYITLKAESGTQGARHELEFEIHPQVARLLEKEFATVRVEKDRYLIPAGNGLKWEVDVFKGDNAPLVTAEIELPDAGAHFVKPAWVGADVTDIGRYTNAALATHPYGQWSAAEKEIPSGLAR